MPYERGKIKTQISSALTRVQTQLFLRDGFLALEQITSPEAVQSLKPAFERLFESRAGRERGMHFDFAGTDEDDASFGLPQIMSPSRFVPDLLHTELMANVRSIAAQILGSRIEFTLDHALLKPAALWGNDPLASGRGVQQPRMGPRPGQLLDPPPGSDRGEWLSPVHPRES